jgi:hypothetical protein
MFSERKLDGIERGKEQYFKRANGKNPERGGHPKSDRFTNSKGPEEVVAMRARWAEVQNQALARAGVEARVDHRSFEDQGIEREAGRHRGPALSGIEGRGEASEVSARREAEQVERAQARAAAVAEVRVVTRQEVAAERVAVRERRELAREVTGEEREAVLPLIEADRREQLGRASAAAERRVERRQGVGGQLGKKLVEQARALRERIGREFGRVREWVAKRFPDPVQRLTERSREVFEAVTRGGRSAPGQKETERTPSGDRGMFDGLRLRADRLPAAVIEVAPGVEPAAPKPAVERSDQVRAAAREAGREERAGPLGSWQAPNLEDVKRQGREEWLAMRAQVQARGGDLSAEQQRAQGRAAWKVLRGLEGEMAQPAAREPAQNLKEAARERERLSVLSAKEMWGLIERINPAPVERLVELDSVVTGAQRVVESHQLTAANALHASNWAAHENQWWRREHGVQAKLHDLGVRKAEYLVEREAAEAKAKAAHAEALKASALAQARLLEARSEAERRITQETAPARAKVAELERLAAAAYEREQVVQEFQRLARSRAAGREEFRDTSESWQATPPKLRQLIDGYNQEPAQVQEAILKKFSTTPALAQSLEENLKLRREQVHTLGRGRGR